MTTKEHKKLTMYSNSCKYHNKASELVFSICTFLVVSYTFIALNSVFRLNFYVELGLNLSSKLLDIIISYVLKATN